MTGVSIAIGIGIGVGIAIGFDVQNVSIPIAKAFKSSEVRL